MPNFRKLTVNKEKVEKVKIESTISQNSGCENNERWDTSLGSHKIYRSSKPDYMTEEDVSRFCNLNFQTIIDLRSYEEYIKGEGDKLLDYYYPLYKVRITLVSEKCSRLLRIVDRFFWFPIKMFVFIHNNWVIFRDDNKNLCYYIRSKFPNGETMKLAKNWFSKN